MSVVKIWSRRIRVRQPPAWPMSMSLTKLQGPCHCACLRTLHISPQGRNEYKKILKLGSYGIFKLFDNLDLVSPLDGVDAFTDLSGGHLVGQVLKSHGIGVIFTVCGIHISPILVGCADEGIRVIDTRNEATAVFAADATARITRNVGVAVVTAGPGVTNTITAMKNAQMAGSPVILIGGSAASAAKDYCHSPYDIEQLKILKSVCKDAVQIDTCRKIIPGFGLACSLAQSGVPGPVFLELPMDVVYPYKTVANELLLDLGFTKSFTQYAAQHFMLQHLWYIFAGAHKKRDWRMLAPWDVNYKIALPEQIEESVKLIRESKRPLILLDTPGITPPTPVDAISEALIKMGIPVFLSGMARGILGRDSELEMRLRMKEALKDADLVLLAGSICDHRLGYGRMLAKRGKTIVVHRDKSLLHINSYFWKPSQQLAVDVAEYLVALSNALDDYHFDPKWIPTLRKREEDAEAEIIEKGKEPPDAHLNPIKLLQQLDKVLPDNAILIFDGGDFSEAAAKILRPRGPLTFLDAGPFGALGIGAGFALGAKIARPDSSVWVIYGDGAVGYSLMEFDTYARHKVNVTSLVGNNAMWLQVARDQGPRFNNTIGCKLTYADYHNVVNALKGNGQLIDGKDGDNLVEIFSEAIASSSKSSESLLINAIIGQTDLPQKRTTSFHYEPN